MTTAASTPSGRTPPTVRTELSDAVAHVLLDRPDDMNRFAGSMREELLDALRAATSDPTVGCVVLRGAGDHFCAGAELGSMLDLQAADDAEEIRRRVELGGEVVAGAFFAGIPGFRSRTSMLVISSRERSAYVSEATTSLGNPIRRKS